MQNYSNTRIALITLVAAMLVVTQASRSPAALITRNVDVTLNASNLDSYNLDVDQNGSTDFTFQAAYVPDPTLTVGFDQITFPFGGINGVVIDTQTGDGFPPTSLLGPGSVVSSNSLFSSSNDTADLFFDDTLDPTTGNFEGKTGFVGLEFAAADGIHYGYAMVTVASLADPNNPLNLTIGSLVYNDVAGVAVQIAAVPEPASIALFAVAGVGLMTRSRRNKSV